MLYDLLFGNASARATGKRPQTGALGRRRLHVEPLEDRRMLSGVHSALALNLSPATPDPTTITWTSTSGSSVYGQKVTLVADVTTTGTGPVTGIVDFFNNGGTKPIGKAPVLATGEADFATGKLPLGSDVITATYVGNATFASSTTSASVTQKVAAASTTTVLYAFPNPTGYGQKTLLTATVSPVSPSMGKPTGTVTFDLVTDPSNTQTLTPLGTSNVGPCGVASLQTSALPLNGAGDVIEAVYTPANGNFTGSTSPTVTEVVNKGQPKVGISLPSTTTRPITSGESLTFTATVSAGGYAFPVVFPFGCGLATSDGTPATGLPDPVAPNGDVNFYDGTTLLNTGGPIALVGGKATFTTTTLPVGLNAISVQYLGDANYLTGSSRTLYVCVTTSTATTETTSTASSKTSCTIAAGGFAIAMAGGSGSTTAYSIAASGCTGSTNSSGASASTIAQAVASVFSALGACPKLPV